MQEVITVLDLLSVDKLDDLLFKCRPELKGKAENVKAEKTACSRCGMPHIFKWNFTLNGEWKNYQVDHICSACRKSSEAKTLTGEFEEKRKAQLDKIWYNISELDDYGFKNYKNLGKATERALKEAKAYAKDILSGKKMNLLMMGSTGTGKTHLAKAIARTFKEKDVQVAYVEAAALFDMIKATFGNEKEKERLIKQYKSFDVVVIDDMGVETVKLDEVSWGVREWTRLIDAREGQSSVWTTNFDESNFGDIVGRRTFSRMYMNTRFIDLFTDDYRKNFRIS